jgi:hypothetical protein
VTLDEDTVEDDKVEEALDDEGEAVEDVGDGAALDEVVEVGAAEEEGVFAGGEEGASGVVELAAELDEDGLAPAMEEDGLGLPAPPAPLLPEPPSVLSGLAAPPPLFVLSWRAASRER